MQTIIPEKFEFTCDGCGLLEYSASSKSVPMGWGKFVFTKIGRDFAGHAVGGHKYDLDLCEGCCTKSHDFIRGRAK